MTSNLTVGAQVPRRYALYRTRGFDDLALLAFRVALIFPMAGIACIFGPSGAGKSFLVALLMYALSTGKPFFGHATVRCKVLCLVLEGDSGFRDRIRALEAYFGETLPDEAVFMFDKFRLNERADVADLIRAIEADNGVDVIIVETFNRATGGADENSSQQIGLAIAGIDELRAATGALVIIVHHTGKDESRGMRGHSSLHAAMDAAIEVHRNGNSRSWKLAKAKDGADGDVAPFELLDVEFVRSDGTKSQSCVVNPTASTMTTQPGVIQAKGSNQTLVLQALTSLISESQVFGKGGAPVDARCIDFEVACRTIKDQLPVPTKRQYERTKIALNQLVANGVIMSGEGWLWAA